MSSQYFENISLQICNNILRLLPFLRIDLPVLIINVISVMPFEQMLMSNGSLRKLRDCKNTKSCTHNSY